jgi:hypothetical protein
MSVYINGYNDYDWSPLNWGLPRGEYLVKATLSNGKHWGILPSYTTRIGSPIPGDYTEAYLSYELDSIFKNNRIYQPKSDLWDYAEHIVNDKVNNKHGTPLEYAKKYIAYHKGFQDNQLSELSKSEQEKQKVNFEIISVEDAKKLIVDYLSTLELYDDSKELFKEDKTNRFDSSECRMSFVTDGTLGLIMQGLYSAKSEFEEYLAKEGKSIGDFDIWVYDGAVVGATKDTPYMHNTTYVYAIRKGE